MKVRAGRRPGARGLASGLPALAPLLLSLSILLCGCPRTAPTAGPPPAPDELPSLREEVDAMRRAAEELHRRQALLVWSSWVEGASFDSSSLYEEHSDLLSEGALRSVTRLGLAPLDQDERHALELLEAHLLSELLAAAASGLDERISRIEAGATMVVDGRELPYREAGRLLAHERDWHRRGNIHLATLPVIEEMTPLLRERRAQVEEAARDLGHENLLEAAALARRVDVSELALLARAVLDSTEEAYRTELASLASKRMGLGPESFRWADVPRLFRAGDLDEHFPPDEMLPRLSRLLRGMGLSLDAGDRVRVDKSGEPRKNPRAICIPVEIPGDIRLSIKPMGGLSDYRALFHEMGHAQQFAAITEPGFEMRHLGDATVGEAFAFLLEGVLADPVWLAEETDLAADEVAETMRLQTLERIYLARRHAGKVLFELALLKGDLEEHDSPESLYAALMEEAYGFPLGPGGGSRWAVDQDDLLYAADYLRAFVLEAQIADHLKSAHGSRWWASPEAGRWMRETWSLGARTGAEDLARAVGAPSLDPLPLARRLPSLTDQER